MPLFTKPCEQCNTVFTSRNELSRFCSRSCSAFHTKPWVVNMKHRVIPTLTCEHCGIAFKPNHIKDADRGQRHCSRSCASANSPRDASKLVRKLWSAGKYEKTRAGKGVQHHYARVWRLRDPNGKTWDFKNVAQFIRDHHDLFDDEDLLPRGKFGHIRAVQGLASLSPRKKRPEGSWKGWVHVATHERRFYDAEDPINRKP